MEKYSNNEGRCVFKARYKNLPESSKHVDASKLEAAGMVGDEEVYSKSPGNIR
jgi:hypothetical protein